MWTERFIHTPPGPGGGTGPGDTGPGDIGLGKKGPTDPPGVDPPKKIKPVEERINDPIPP
jgi:hypothetical protein